MVGCAFSREVLTARYTSEWPARPPAIRLSGEWRRDRGGCGGAGDGTDVGGAARCWWLLW